jgi:mannose-6-phosphate isomerase
MQEKMATQPESGSTRPFTAPKFVPKPWGREIWYAHEDRYAGKVLEVTRGHALSLQKHERKMETLYLRSGRILFHFNGVDHEMAAGECITIRPGDIHRMEALEDSVFLEVSTPELDDVIRLEDRYGRS